VIEFDGFDSRASVADGKWRCFQMGVILRGAMDYSGTAYHSSLRGGRAGGSLELAPDRLLFRGDQGVLELPWDGLVIEHGGTGGRLLYFKHPLRADLVFSTADPAILQEPLLQGRPGVRAAALNLKRTQRWNLGGVGMVAALFLGVIAFLWLGQNLWIGAAVRQVPREWEEKLGDLIFSQVSRQYTLIEDPAVTESFAKLTGPLVAVANEQGYAVRLHITDESDINAFAIPGGHLVFHSGLLLKAKSPDEVLGVLAHEMGHIQKRHSLRQMARGLGMYAAIQVLLGDMTGWGAALQDGGWLLLQQGYSRDMEREADDAGRYYLARMGKSTDGMIQFFGRLQEEENKSLGSIPAFLSTHPATTERIARLQQGAGKGAAGTVSEVANEFDFSAFQNILRAKIRPEKPKPETKTSPHASPH
jgi:beta-barrel assembly-enhancing protease